MKVAIGDKHLCILMSSGDVKCLGDKSYGILGNADNGDIGLRASDMGSNLGSVNLGTGRTAIQLFGVDYTCALLDNNQVKCFGVPDSNLSFTNVERGKFANTMGDNLEALNLGAGFSITSLIWIWLRCCWPCYNLVKRMHVLVPIQLQIEHNIFQV